MQHDYYEKFEQSLIYKYYFGICYMKSPPNDFHNLQTVRKLLRDSKGNGQKAWKFRIDGISSTHAI